MRFVLETNVVVSALLIADSIPRRAFDKALTQGTLIISVPIMLELAEVLHRKQFNKYLLEEERMRFLVGGDDDLLVLNPFRGIQVITPREFLTWNNLTGRTG